MSIQHEHQHPRPPGSNVEVIQAAYRAFRTRDVNALLALFAPDVQWVHPRGMSVHGLGGVRHGHAGVLAFLSRVPYVIGGMQLEPREYVVSGDRVVVFGTRQVTSLHGHTEQLDFVHSWTFRDGKAVRMEDIFDTVLFHELIAAHPGHSGAPPEPDPATLPAPAPAPARQTAA
ncbi:limonene-1,2-epoxide hydrolase [Streptomyces sp. CB03234]|uniref:nuclear transport factor 2 family protein n=1 Tax=Streptomyces sp. (strain CB03234) TaxID=1703937 RepID=UPI00093A708D|nr:nuclear transport factor 2 family protein [Streptomyces sp. CB03234]OKK04827.1 limonene-1,2-epoxide hydrolase [Streptomyces sp. CB03234]